MGCVLLLEGERERKRDAASCFREKFSTKCGSVHVGADGDASAAPTLQAFLETAVRAGLLMAMSLV